MKLEMNMQNGMAIAFAISACWSAGGFVHVRKMKRKVAMTTTPAAATTNQDGE